MTHYRMQYDMPSGIILAKNPRTSSLDELRTYQDNTIYLNNGDEFQIQLFNPLKEKIGVQIGINGETSNGLLVLNPGEEVTLDRFLDDKSKMLFETYNYDANNKSASNAVSNNGIVEINFFKEIKIKRMDIQSIYSTRNLSTKSFNNTTTGTYTTGTYDTSNLYLTNSFDSIQISDDNLKLDFASDPLPKNIKETGRVEKGDESNQSFKSVDVKFENFSFYSIIYNLKPTSERGTTVTDTKIREYCPSCRYRIRNNKWNFCPKCGEEI